MKKNTLIQTFSAKINDENIFSHMAQSLIVYLKDELNENPTSFNSENKNKLKQKLEKNMWDNDNQNLKYEKAQLFHETKIQNDAFVNTLKTKEKEIIYKKNRTALKEEITIHNNFRTRVPNYFDRKNFDLMRIVEDQVFY